MAKARCLTGHQFSRVQLPTNRQVSYHLVDIKLPEVSTLLRAALLSKPGGPVEYNPIDGWLSSGYQQYTRIIMAKALRAWVFRLGDETAQSSARSNSGSRGRGLCQSRTNSALGYRRKTQ
ncbi:unnamed protein product [Protopolystoma xenopodis]|uniref:Uncharacterized protein n=1 Tax=Protopolystoma xenopodis TaxID=117903 RepID=A0A3S5CC46_9PLAT|nr:unnamed protein product [Protopolystoma xenopodis]